MISMGKSRVIPFLNYPYHCLIVIAVIRAGIMDASAREGTVKFHEPDSTAKPVSLDIEEDPEYNRQLDFAIAFQQKADSLYHLSVDLRKQAGRSDDPVERARFRTKIAATEDSMRVYQELAERQFTLLQRPGNPYIVLDTVLHGIRIYRYNLSFDTVTRKEDTAFAIFDTSAYGPGRAFEHDFILPSGVFYRIQIAVFSRDIPAGHFGGLFPITTEKIADRAMTRYFVGKFTHLDRARDALQKVRAAGYSDAFVIGYYDGVQGTPEKLQALEKD